MRARKTISMVFHNDVTLNLENIINDLCSQNGGMFEKLSLECRDLVSTTRGSHFDISEPLQNQNEQKKH